MAEYVDASTTTLIEPDTAWDALIDLDFEPPCEHPKCSDAAVWIWKAYIIRGCRCGWTQLLCERHLKQQQQHDYAVAREVYCGSCQRTLGFFTRPIDWYVTDLLERVRIGGPL